MAGKARKKSAKSGSPPTRRSRQANPVRKRSSSPPTRSRRAAEAIEEIRQGPLQPEIILKQDAPLDTLDPDALEALKETQTLQDDSSPSGGVGNEIDRRRGIVLTGGDVDAAWDEVDVGEETVGGSTPTPDQDVVDELGRASGVTYGDTEPFRAEEKILERDEKRWELDPASAEDYPLRAGRPRRKSRR